jgi:hypothetical protein
MNMERGTCVPASAHARIQRRARSSSCMAGTDGREACRAVGPVRQLVEVEDPDGRVLRFGSEPQTPESNGG